MFGAVDVGGTKTLVGVFDKAGKLLEESRFETPKIYEDFRLELAKAVDDLSTKDLISTAVAMPGLIDRGRGGVIVLGNLPWKNVPIRDDFEKIFHSPVIVENDAKVGALYEAKKLTSPKHRKVLYITVSTGIGIGFCVDGRILTELQDMEAGSMMLEHGGKLQKWEDFASGRAIKEKFGKKASDITDPKAWGIIADNLAIGVIDLMAVLSPDVIVFGGGVGAHFEKFKDSMITDLKKYKTAMVLMPDFVKADKPEEAVIYGCYELAKDKHESLSN